MPFSAITGQPVDTGAVSVTVPAGKYFLGDPCYTFPQDHWAELLDSCDFFRQLPGKAAGLEVIAFSTAYGDGVYDDNHGNSYPVDAGLIGLVPVREGTCVNDDLVTEVEFTEPTVCTHDGFGRMTFGDYAINTNDDEDDTDEDDTDDDGPEYYDGDGWGDDSYYGYRDAGDI